jgi:aryl-alcohol dehydrogenase-like predicted oxidoreductase
VIESEVIPVSEELGISQLTWSPLAQGVLSGKYRPGRLAPGGSRATDTASGGAAMIKRWMADDVLEAVQKLHPVAEDLGLTMTQLALAWVLKSPNVASAITGASRPEQIIDNVRAVDVDLPPEAVATIDAILEGVTISDPALTAEFTPAARPV